MAEQFFVRLLGTRPDWPADMTEAEQEVMGVHRAYLDGLAAEGKVLLAGPVFDPTFGLIVLETEDRDEAVRLMEAEPSVTGGLHTYEMQPMRAVVRASKA